MSAAARELATPGPRESEDLEQRRKLLFMVSYSLIAIEAKGSSGASELPIESRSFHTLRTVTQLILLPDEFLRTFG